MYNQTAIPINVCFYKVYLKSGTFDCSPICPIQICQALSSASMCRRLCHSANCLGAAIKSTLKELSSCSLTICVVREGGKLFSLSASVPSAFIPIIVWNSMPALVSLLRRTRRVQKGFVAFEVCGEHYGLRVASLFGIAGYHRFLCCFTS